MQRTQYKLKKDIDSSSEIKKHIDIGKCIKLIHCEKNYQVIGFNPNTNICWVREWPLNFCSYKTFELSLNKISVLSSCQLQK